MNVNEKYIGLEWKGNDASIKKSVKDAFHKLSEEKKEAQNQIEKEFDMKFLALAKKFSSNKNNDATVAVNVVAVESFVDEYSWDKDWNLDFVLKKSQYLTALITIRPCSFLHGLKQIKVSALKYVPQKLNIKFKRSIPLKELFYDSINSTIFSELDGLFIHREFNEVEKVSVWDFPKECYAF